ncbi:MAG: hypothetical protein RCG15_00460 [Candidatus Rickettsia vulgarisii]
MTKIFNQLANHMCLLTKMDTGSYVRYRQALVGTSGGDSASLRNLSHLILSMHLVIPAELMNIIKTQNFLYENSNNCLLNQLISSIRELQSSTAEFWLRHFNLALNTIGLIKGTGGLPVDKLLSYAIKHALEEDSIISTV